MRSACSTGKRGIRGRVGRGEGVGEGGVAKVAKHWHLERQGLVEITIICE